MCFLYKRKKNNSKTIKALEERKNSLYDHELGNYFLDRTQKEPTLKGEVSEKLDFPQIKNISFPRMTTEDRRERHEMQTGSPLPAQDQTGRQGRRQTSRDAGTPHPRPRAEAPTPFEVGPLGGAPWFVRYQDRKLSARGREDALIKE